MMLMLKKKISKISDCPVRTHLFEISAAEFHKAVQRFYNTRKRHELAGSGLALNYVICSRTVKHYQIMNAATEKNN